MINKDKNLFLQQKRNVIAITSGVGSMGKTWLALTLAHAVNSLKNSVLLFDADNGLLNTEFQIGVALQGEIKQVLSENKTLNQIITPLNRKKFDIIADVPGSNVLEGVSAGRLQILREDISVIAQNYDYTFVDLPSEEELFKHFLPSLSELILVCTNEPSNLVSTYNFLQEIPNFAKYKNLRIIVNYANSYEEGLQTYNVLRHACEQYIKILPPLLGVVRRDTRVRDAINNKVLLLNRYPSSEAAQDIMQIARRMVKMEKTYD